MSITIIRICFILFCIITLEVVVRVGLVDQLLMPPPTEIFSALKSIFESGRIWSHLGITSIQILSAALISIPAGIFAGLLLAKSWAFEKIFGSFIYFLVSVPKSIFLPIFILALGVGGGQKVAFGVFQGIFVIAINTAAATANVPQLWIKTGIACGASTWQLYTKIYIPAMIPMILEGIRLGIIFIVTGVILSEMYASRDGLGYLISSYSNTFNMSSLIAVILVAAFLSILANEALRVYEKRVSTWRE